MAHPSKTILFYIKLFFFLFINKKQVAFINLIFLPPTVMEKQVLISRQHPMIQELWREHNRAGVGVQNYNEDYVLVDSSLLRGITESMTDVVLRSIPPLPAFSPQSYSISFPKDTFSEHRDDDDLSFSLFD